MGIHSTALWVVVSLKDQLYGIAADSVREMVNTPKVVGVPMNMPYLRGLVNLRGHTAPLVDLRMRLGMDSFLHSQEQLIEIFKVREQDHVNWLIELEASVKEKRPFKLSTDPHKCAFGRWYDTYKSDNMMVQNLLARFDAPHKHIHGIAAQVVSLEGQNRHEDAYALIERTRNTELATMIRLFASARMLVTETARELCVVVERLGRLVALTVDRVHGVEPLQVDEASTMEALTALDTGGLLQGVGTSRKGELVLMLNLPAVLDEAAAQTAELHTQGAI